MRKFILIALLTGISLQLHPALALGLKLKSLRLELNSSYDDNILRYSDRDLDRFRNGTEIYPSRLSTYDDWKNDLILKSNFEFPTLPKKPLKIRYNFKFSSYLRNPFNNYVSHTLLMSQSLSRRFEVNFRYFYMPGYYLREYFDRDLNQAHSCTFDDQQVSLGVSYKMLKSTEVSFAVEYEQAYYNQYFTEYDGQGWLYEAEVQHRLNRNLRLNFYYGFKFNDNIGYQAYRISPSDPGSVEDTEYGDSSFEEDIFQIGLNHNLKKILGAASEIDLQYRLRRRYYTTSNAIDVDPFHSGRSDFRHRLNVQFFRALNENFEAGITLTREWRTVTSDNPLTVDIKEFQQNLFTLCLRYKII